MSRRVPSQTTARARCVLTACLVILGSAGTPAVEGLPSKDSHVLIALARDYELQLLVGQYDAARKKWLSNTQAFVPPGVQAPFTLFGVSGKIAGVRLADNFTTRRDEPPWAWNVTISTWDRSDTTVALAVSGEWAELPRPGVVLSTGDAGALIAAAAFLKEKHLDVSQPRVTQVLRVDLNADGREATLICANSDTSELTDDASAAVYSLALLRIDLNGQSKILPLRVAAANKPAGQSLEEFHNHHGSFTFFQVLALVDVERSGHEQIVLLNDNPDYGPEIDLYALDAGKISHPLTARVVYF